MLLFYNWLFNALCFWTLAYKRLAQFFFKRNKAFKEAMTYFCLWFPWLLGFRDGDGFLNRMISIKVVGISRSELASEYSAIVQSQL